MTPFPNSPWPLVPVGDVCAPKEKAEPQLDPESEFQYVDISGVSNERFTIQSPRRVSGAEAPSRARKRIRKDDVIVATTRPYLRSIARVSDALDGQVCSTGFCVLRPTDRVLRDWLYYSVLCQGFTDQLIMRMRGANYPAVTDRDVLESVIPIPPLGEQSRISHCIGKCMGRIDEIRKLSSKAAMESAGLLPSSLSTTFTELRGTYPTATVGDCLVESRYGTSRRCDAGASAVPVLRIPNVAQGRVFLDNLRYCELGNEELERFRMESGDILVVRTNGSPDLVGRCGVHVDNNRSFAFASYLIRLRVNRAKVLPGFLMFFLTSTMGRDAIATIRRTSAGQFNINVQNLRGIRLPLPPLAIQAGVVDRLTEQRDVAAAIRADQTTHATDADLLMNAVLRRAFAGDL